MTEHDATGRPPPAAGPAGEGFGEAMERLEAIVARLEGDETLGLEEALALYEQGVALAGECRRRLAGAQLRLTEVAVPAVTPLEPFDDLRDGGAGAGEDGEEDDGEADQDDGDGEDGAAGR
jgi:exodeoxyribonuclease VII small subunit